MWLLLPSNSKQGKKHLQVNSCASPGGWYYPLALERERHTATIIIMVYKISSLLTIHQLYIKKAIF
jgi:hypothetical protein